MFVTVNDNHTNDIRHRHNEKKKKKGGGKSVQNEKDIVPSVLETRDE